MYTDIHPYLFILTGQIFSCIFNHSLQMHFFLVFLLRYLFIYFLKTYSYEFYKPSIKQSDTFLIYNNMQQILTQPHAKTITRLANALIENHFVGPLLFVVSFFTVTALLEYHCLRAIIKVMRRLQTSLRNN